MGAGVVMLFALSMLFLVLMIAACATSMFTGGGMATLILTQSACAVIILYSFLRSVQTSNDNKERAKHGVRFSIFTFFACLIYIILRL